jgi:hypothetical protein
MVDKYGHETTNIAASSGVQFRATAIVAALWLVSLPASGQFIKQIDADGHVTYSQEPSYDYSADEPSEENRRIIEEQLRRLREFNKYRVTLPKAEPRAPKMTIRTGRSICKKKISVRKLTSPGC